MPEIYLIKNYGMLAPADEEAEEIIAGMKQGQVMKLEYTLPRNYENHKRFFAFINLTFGIQNHFDNSHHYRKWLIMKSGYYTTITAPNGYTIFDADSIAFDKMDETKFRKLFNDCVQTFINAFGDIIPKDKLDEIVRF